MKTLLTTILFSTALFSAKAADIYVNNSGQGGTYTTIGAAIAAAAPNDRVFVSPYGAYTENLVITQNITLTSAVSGTSFNVVGNLTINGAPNMEVRVIGGEFSSNCTATTGGATLVNKSDVYLIDSKFSGISGQDYMRMHVLFCDMGTGSLNIRHGEIRGCQTGQVTIADGPNAGVGDTLFIVGNVFNSGYLTWSNNDNYFYIANNYINQGNSYCLRITNHHYSSAVNNNIYNNTFSNSGNQTNYYTPIRSLSTSNLDNIYAYNNILENRYGSSSTYARVLYATGQSGGTIKLYYNYLKGYSNATTTGGTKVVGNTSVGYTGANLTLAADGSCNSATFCVDQGSPALQFYDIDLTRNDRGTFGGPYSIDNYTATGTGNARVFDLDMPFEIWSGQTPQVKAESTHTK